VEGLFSFRKDVIGRRMFQVERGAPYFVHILTMDKIDETKIMKERVQDEEK